MKRINFYLTALAFETSAHVGTLAVPRPTIPTAVESIDVIAGSNSNGTSAGFTRFPHGACDLAPKQYWDKEIASRNAEKNTETASIELVERENASGYTAWISQMFLNMATLCHRLPITSFLTGHLVFLSNIDVADTAAVKHKSDKLSEAKNTKITDNNDAKHRLRLRGINTGRVSSGDSLARQVPVLPAEGPLNNDLFPAGFETGDGAVYVDKVIKRDASKDTRVVAAKIYKPHSITYKGHTVRPNGNPLHEISNDEVKAFIHDAFAPFAHSDTSDSFSLAKRAYDGGRTSKNIGLWIIGSVLLFVLAYGIWCWIKHYCQHRVSQRNVEHDAHDPNSESADPIQTIAIPEMNEADMPTDEEMRIHASMLESCPHIHINGVHAPEQAHVAPPRSNLSFGSGSLLALHDLPPKFEWSSLPHARATCG